MIAADVTGCCPKHMRRGKAYLLLNMLQGERALAAFQQVCPAQLQPGIKAFNMAISACAPGEVRPVQLHPGVGVCTAQLQLPCNSASHVVSAEDSTVWVTLLQALPRASLALALQLLRRAKQQGLHPDAAIYTALLGLCARAGRGRTAARLHKVPQRLSHHMGDGPPDPAQQQCASSSDLLSGPWGSRAQDRQRGTGDHESWQRAGRPRHTRHQTKW